MGRPYSVQYAVDIKKQLDELDITAEELVQHFMSWLNADTLCAALEDFCVDNDIDLEEDEDD